MIWNFRRPEQGLLSMDHGLQRTTGLSPATAQVCVNPKGLQGEVTRSPDGFCFFLPQGFSWTTLLRFWSYHVSSSCPSSTLFSGIPMIPCLEEWTDKKLGWEHKAGPWLKEDRHVGSFTPGWASHHLPSDIQPPSFWENHWTGKYRPESHSHLSIF